ncbi:MAG: DMT family transporter [Burkholderiales bacterium]|nr:DMT family transporter [Burkholderiales bacterium]
MLAAITDSRPSNFRGILYMLCAAVLFSVMGVIARYVAQRIHPSEVAFFRISMGLVLLLPLILSYGLKHFRTQRFGLHFARAAGHVTEMQFYFAGLVMIQYAQVQALTFTTPLFATVLAVVVLRERIHARRITALVIGFVGALIVIRPGFAPVDTGSVYILISALGWAGIILVTKRLTRTDSSLTITAWMVVLMSPMALIPALFVWTWPTWTEFGWLVLIGILGTLGQLAVTQAFRVADTTSVLPFDFSKLIWAALLGYLVFGEVPAIWTWIGGSAIFACGFYVALRERQLQEKRSA